MIVTPLKTDKIHAGSCTLTELLDTYIKELAERSVVVITSKIVSLCENRVVGMEGTDYEELIKQESALFLPRTLSQYGHHFSISHHSLVGAAGIDESNGDGHHILWPVDPQKTANEVRDYLQERFEVTEVGVIITDSTSTPLRLGAMGMCLSHSGFVALHDYRKTPDLFGRPFTVSRANVSGGLSAAAVVAMGEGTEQTPLAIITEIPLVEFQDHHPTKAELSELNVSMEEDLFGVFLKDAPWQKGDLFPEL